MGLEVLDLAASDAFSRKDDRNELCVVLLIGSAHAEAGGRDFGTIGGRESRFAGSPSSVY